MGIAAQHRLPLRLPGGWERLRAPVRPKSAQAGQARDLSQPSDSLRHLGGPGHLADPLLSDF